MSKSEIKNRIDLYSKDKKGSLRIWSIWRQDSCLYTEYGLESGEKIIRSESIPGGKGGRNLKEQIKMRINSRVNKKIDSGYSKSKTDADKKTHFNALGYPVPMKAKSLVSADKIPFGELWIQHKLNGHRCLIASTKTGNIAYSKGGKIINSIPEIVNSIKIPYGCILDGELYSHGIPLQTISSWVRKKQSDSDNLEYKCFDAIIPGTFKTRMDFIKNNIEFCSRSQFVWTAFLTGEFNVLPILRKVLDAGYEGLMIRQNTLEYENIGRSAQILKVKRKVDKSFLLDNEFLVVDIKKSVDKWAVLVCETETGIRFRISAPGTLKQKRKILKKKKRYIGKHIRIEFEGYTIDKKPVEAVALEWREKFGE